MRCDISFSTLAFKQDHMTSEHGYQYETNNNNSRDEDGERDDPESDDSVEEGDDVNEDGRDRFYCECCKHSTLRFTGIIYHRSTKHGKATRLNERDKFRR